MTYETAGARPTPRNYPESWGQPEGRAYSVERRNWIQRNITRNPRFKMEQLAGQEKRQLRRDIEALDVKLKAMGITPPPLDW